MKLISCLLEKFKQTASPPKPPTSITNSSTDPQKNQSNHNEPKKYEQLLNKFEARQKREDEVREMSKDRRTLRRQNNFLGFTNYILLLQNQKLASEKHDWGVERQILSERRKELSKSLRKQRRISEYYRRRLVEIQKQEKIIIG